MRNQEGLQPLQDSLKGLPEWASERLMNRHGFNRHLRVI